MYPASPLPFLAKEFLPSIWVVDFQVDRPKAYVLFDYDYSNVCVWVCVCECVCECECECEWVWVWVCVCAWNQNVWEDIMWFPVSIQPHPLEKSPSSRRQNFFSLIDWFPFRLVSFSLLARPSLLHESRCYPQFPTFFTHRFSVTTYYRRPNWPNSADSAQPITVFRRYKPPSSLRQTPKRMELIFILECDCIVKSKLQSLSTNFLLNSTGLAFIKTAGSVELTRQRVIISPALDQISILINLSIFVNLNWSWCFAMKCYNFTDNKTWR